LSRKPQGALNALLPTLPAISFQRRLARCVSYLDFEKGRPPQYLFSSGRRNRCNPQGVRCLYFSEDESTAHLEYRYAWRGTPAEHQPKLTFFAQAHLRRILDLGDPAVAEALALSDGDFFKPWLLRRTATRLQKLGLAVSRQSAVTALRYPSAACRAAGEIGWNLAIFVQALAPPDRVEILGSAGAALEILP
jgi:RES domain-containing protein